MAWHRGPFLGFECPKKGALQETVYRYSSFSLLQLLEEVGWFEVFRNWVVQAGNDLVDAFLPRLLSVFAALDGFEELLQSLFDDVAEIRGDLEQMRETQKSLPLVGNLVKNE